MFELTIDNFGSFLRARPTPAARSADLPLKLEIVTERARFDALEPDWNALFARAGRSTHVFQNFNWMWHWANHYMSNDSNEAGRISPCIVLGWRDGALIMVWPLVKQRVRGIAQIFWMGEPVSQYGDVLLDDLPDRLQVLREGWRFLKANIDGDIVRLRRVRADAVIAPLMSEIGALASNAQTAPYLDLASARSFSDYEQRYSAKARKNRRRLLRRLEDQGKVSFLRISAGGPEARNLAGRSLEFKARWLQERGLVSQTVGDARMAGFFAAIAEARERPAGCTVTALEVNGEIAAAEVMFACKDRLAVHVIAYDLKFEKAGAGVLLFERGICDACEEGFATIDMLAPGDNYKLDWADASVEVNDWSRPLTIAGYTYARLYLIFLRDRLKFLSRTLPQSWRRLFARNHKQLTSA